MSSIGLFRFVSAKTMAFTDELIRNDSRIAIFVLGYRIGIQTLISTSHYNYDGLGRVKGHRLTTPSTAFT